MIKINCTIELSESDIKCAIARYIEEMYGFRGYTNDIRHIKLNHEEDVACWGGGFEEPITTYSATFKIGDE